MEALLKKIKLTAKKYFYHFIAVSFAILGLAVLLCSLFDSSSDTNKRIKKIIDKAKDNVQDIKLQKKEIEVIEKINRQRLIYYREHAEEKLEKIKEIEDKKKRLEKMVDFYETL
jgi:hypothetical protein